MGWSAAAVSFRSPTRSTIAARWAWTVADCALMLDAIAGTIPPTPRRFAIL